MTVLGAGRYAILKTLTPPFAHIAFFFYVQIISHTLTEYGHMYKENDNKNNNIVQRVYTTSLPIE